MDNFKRLQEIAGLNEWDNELYSHSSDETIDRMDSLANISDLKICKDKLRFLTSDWLNEGFEKEDVKKFISNFIDQI